MLRNLFEILLVVSVESSNPSRVRLGGHCGTDRNEKRGEIYEGAELTVRQQRKEKTVHAVNRLDILGQVSALTNMTR